MDRTGANSAYRPEGYGAVFGAEPGFAHRRPDGAIGHVELRLNDAIIMLGRSDQDVPAHVHVQLAARAEMGGAA